jgi:hypothetical protein
MDKIHHIAIQVPDISKGVDWYVKNFETKVLHQGESSAYIKYPFYNKVEILKNNNKNPKNNE